MKLLKTGKSIDAEGRCFKRFRITAIKCRNKLLQLFKGPQKITKITNNAF